MTALLSAGARPAQVLGTPRSPLAGRQARQIARRPLGRPGLGASPAPCSLVAPRAQGGGKYPPIYQSPYDQPPPANEPPRYGGGTLLSEEEERDRLAAGTALRNIGWLSFWSQLVLTVVSAVILLFSVGVTSEGVVNLNLINVSTLVGVVAALISTFLAWTYVQAGRKLGMLQEVALSKLEGTVLKGTTLNLVGMGSTLIGLQATVGGLVAKTLSSAAAGPFYRGAAPPPVAFDVFSVQACTNTVMAHFLAIAFSNWLLRVLNTYIQKAAHPAPSAPPLPLV